MMEDTHFYPLISIRMLFKTIVDLIEKIETSEEQGKLNIMPSTTHRRYKTFRNLLVT